RAPEDRLGRHLSPASCAARRLSPPSNVMSASGLHRHTTTGLASPAAVEAIRNACGDLALGGTFTPARAWERYRETTRAKSMLLAELVGAPADDDLLLLRHRLDAAREGWKRELLD